MKFLITAIFAFVQFNCLSQSLSDSIRFSLYIYYGCEDSLKRINEYTIENRNSDKIVEYKSDSIGICFVPRDLKSNLVIRAPKLYESLPFDFAKESIIDTITIPPIYKDPIQNGFYIGPTYYQYYNCGEVCNGFQKSFRKEGQLWQKGHFKHGKLKFLKSYYPNGFTESLIKNRIINGCDNSYDKNGKLIYKMSYFIVFTHIKIYVKENDKYYQRLLFKRYK